MDLKIELPIKPHRVIDRETELMLIGSCFSENIGVKLADSGFKTHINPFGILFHPLAITQAVKRISSNIPYRLSDLFHTHEDRYVSFDHHGRFSGTDASAVIEQINSSIESAHRDLKTAGCLIITLGTAWVYRHLPGNRIVSNCHKVPGKEFEKELLKVNEIVDSLQEMRTCLDEINPELEIIWTISPVKHLRDGVVENQISKATLILAVSELLSRRGERSDYFPAYEIVNDELRDYRFYESDFAHPNKLATDYIWERFTEACFTSEAQAKVSDAKSISQFIAHRPLHTNHIHEDVFQRIDNFLKKYRQNS